MKAILVIDIEDDVAEKYDVLTVDYTLRGDNEISYDWLDYGKDVKLKPLPMISYAIKNTKTGKWYIGTQLYNANKNGHFRQFCSDKSAKLFDAYHQAEMEMVVRKMPSHYKVVKVMVGETE